jgi:hypothetical protein
LATKELAVTSLQSTISYFLLQQGIFDQKQHGSRPRPPYFSLLFRLKIKLKGRRFDTIEAEWQAVLNTHTEHGFYDTFKKWQMF